MDKIVVLDFGGQYCHLISRRIRDLGVYSEVLPASVSPADLKKVKDLKGLIFSGGAASVYDRQSPRCDKKILDLGLPILGICYGYQFLVHLSGGKVVSGKAGEYGLTALKVKDRVETRSIASLLAGFGKSRQVWMNHRDVVKTLPAGFVVTASTAHSAVAAYEQRQRKIYGVQFHPEVTHTEKGIKILENFALRICRARRQWDMSQIVTSITEEVKLTLGTKRAVIGLSGGVDSSVAAVLVSRAIGRNLTAVYVDTGMMRYRETEFVKRIFKKYNLKLKVIYAGKEFFRNLKGVTDPEKKRKVIGRTFVDVFNREAKKVRADWLIQGTIYSDRIESGITKHSSNIKSHHNVGGLPKKMKLSVYEPLRDFYKDEVRKIGVKVGLPREIITRHVFPGPGLAIRIIGEVTAERADICRRTGYIVEEELRRVGLYEKVWMGFAVLLPIKSVGIQGDERSYKYPVVVRILESKDAMTANFAKVSYDLLEKISTRITNEIREVNRVVYDISNKPPATMEWE